jgi:Tfp pilus assembly protein PilX
MKNFKPQPTNFTRHEEAGVALVIAVIGLLLLTAVAAGMILYSNGDINVDANYRDQQVGLFAAKAGLEEARDRILASNANLITPPCLLPGGAAASGCTATANYATYIVASGVQPWSSSNTFTTESGNTISMHDQEFVNEMAAAGLSAPSGSTWYTSTASNSNYSGPSSNPVPYKWVRVNLKLNKTIDTSTGTAYWVNSNKPAAAEVMFDSTSGSECVVGTASPSPCATSSTLNPVYEVTSFAVTPSGTIRMVQDEVAALTFNLNFPSALTMAGSVGLFAGANSNPYQVDGVDGSGSAPAVPGCSTNSNNKVDAIGATNTTSVNTIDSGIPNNRLTHYTGSCGSTPCVGTVALNTADSTPAQLNQTLQTIEQSANVSLIPTNPPVGGASYTFSNVSSAMPGGSWSNSSTNPQVIYVDGNFDLGPNTGSGLLVVTGNFTYQGNSGWNGIILVVGDGTTTFSGNGGGNGEFDGAIFVATTKDANGNPLSNFGTTNFDISGGGGNGIYYNTCWINYVQQPQTYKLLSAKEISY